MISLQHNYFASSYNINVKSEVFLLFFFFSPYRLFFFFLHFRIVDEMDFE